MPNYTPGPWEFDDQASDYGAVLVHRPEIGQFFYVCTLGTEVPGGAKELMANGDLIAAAPDLLGALRGLFAAVCPDGKVEKCETYFRGPLANAAAAIAKAEGK